MAANIAAVWLLSARHPAKLPAVGTMVEQAPIRRLPYAHFQDLLGGSQARAEVVRCYVKAEPGQGVLDLGCGPASMLTDLPDVRYVGIDSDARRVQAARRAFGARGEFICADAADEQLLAGRCFDRILALGVIHHLDDAAARRCCAARRNP
jgi:SAM-dependent methyltransferase